MTTLALLITASVYTLLSLWVLTRPLQRPLKLALLGVVISSLVVLIPYSLLILPENSVLISIGLVEAATHLLALALLGSLTLYFLNLARAYLPALIGLIIAGLLMGAGIANLSPQLHMARWLTTPPEFGFNLPTGLFGVWASGLLAIYAFTGVRFFRATIPLHANRLLWWLLVLLLIIVGDVMLLLSPTPNLWLGMGLRALGVIGLVYTVIQPRLLDIRYTGRYLVSNLLLIFITATFILAGIGAAIITLSFVPPPQSTLYIMLLAAGLAVLYLPTRRLANRLIDELVLLTDYDSARLVAELSQRTASLLEVEQLTEEIATLLADAVEASHVLLLTFTYTNQEALTEVHAPADHLPAPPHAFQHHSPFLRHLAQQHEPTLQFMLDVDPQFAQLSNSDRRWLQGLGADAYLPLFDEAELVGVLAVGPRASGDAYRGRELQLFTALANQTSVALKNARLYSQQRQLNAEMLLLNENLSVTNTRLTQLDAVKTDFITIASHELRTPLTHLRGYTDVIDMMNQQDDQIDHEQLNDILERMINACARLDDVIGKMLDVAQLDVAAVQLFLGEYKIGDLIDRALAALRPNLTERRIRLTLHPFTGLPPLQADGDRIVQALGHIIGNAIKFTPDGGQVIIAARQVTSLDGQSDGLEIGVQDSGVGIAAQHQELIFEKFYRVGDVNVHSSGNTKFMGAGPGLGLTIARGIIVAHGGRVWVQSPGYNPETLPGSTFYIRLPLKPPSIIATALESDAALAFIEQLNPDTDLTTNL